MADSAGQNQQVLVDSALEQSLIPVQRSLSTFERVVTTHAPLLESLLLQLPTDSILKLYHTSRYLRSFLRSYPTAWKHLSFRLFFPSGTSSPLRVVIPGTLEPVVVPRQSRPYALDQLLMNVVVPFSPCLRSLELDNTAVSGQILISTVLYSRRETLEHLSVRGCKNVSLKYHIIPYLTMFGLQYDVDLEKSIGSSSSTKRLALKSLYTYRCRHHRRRPYLSSSLTRKDSDSEPTHELVNLCHKLGIWTDTAWCSTPAGRCYRRRGYVSMRVPQGSAEVWVVFDRLWRSKNWIGPVDHSSRPPKRDGKLWEHEETGCYGEALGTGESRDLGEGKMSPAHSRWSHKRFVENIRCDNCYEEIPERCEQCSVLMHCVGCRKTLCASCAYDRPYVRPRRPSSLSGESKQPFWWAPGATTSPCLMLDPLASTSESDTLNHNATAPHPVLKFHWCCTEPIFSGGGGISIGTPNRDVDQVRAAPLPRGQGWEDLEYSAQEWSKTFPKYAYGDPRKPDYTLETGHIAMMKWLLGPPDREPTACPRNLCQECYDTPQWKVHCKSCSKPLCIEHDLRGLRLRICGYRDLTLEKMTIQNRPGSSSQQTTSAYASSHVPYMSSSTEFALPYRTHRAVDSTASSFTEENPADGVPDVGSHTLQGADDPPGPISLVHRQLRSVSVSNSNRSRSSSRSSVGCESQSDATKWQGCQSFFCPQYRAVGDQRQRCGSVLRECSSCSVHVCQDCVEANPPCNCSYCEVNYLCPNCLKLRERDGTCRRLEEEKARREQRWKEDMQMLEGILETKMANEVAEFAGQFFNSVEEPCISVEQVEDVHQNAQSPHHVRIFDGSPWMGPIAEEDVVDSIE
ncbi:hypothetical protein AARAC_009429 [Aspergillus arachidicola]|uniref:Uncharacterized protein n=1 Tax=Aspergillus arachidicola TaxID=656916 RepID=A0A2G7FRP0_9EURO|nr:hypothetical protein AARAC_009429 [Aspergillus arachidicola]